MHISILFQVDLGEEHTLELIRTKGVSAFGSNSWITRFTIEYSQDGSTWYSVTSEGSPVECSGNIDRTSPIENVFNPPITARYVRLGAVSWQSSAACQWKILYTSVCTGRYKSFSNKMKRFIGLRKACRSKFKYLFGLGTSINPVWRFSLLFLS